MNHRISISRLSLICILLTLLASGCGGGGGGVVNTGPVPWDGAYSGTYIGSEPGTFTCRVFVDGTMSATVNSPSVGTFTASGSVTVPGQMTISGSGVGGPYIITFTGSFQGTKPNITGSGNWSSTSGFTGTWTCTRTGD